MVPSSGQQKLREEKTFFRVWCLLQYVEWHSEICLRSCHRVRRHYAQTFNTREICTRAFCFGIITRHHDLTSYQGTLLPLSLSDPPKRTRTLKLVVKPCRLLRYRCMYQTLRRVCDVGCIDRARQTEKRTTL